MPIYFIQTKRPSHRLCIVNTPLHTQQYIIIIFFELRKGGMYVNYSPAPRCVPTFPRPQHPKIQILVVLDRHLHRLLLLSPSLFRQHSRIKHQSIVPSHSHHNTPLHHPLFTDSALSSHTPLPDDSRMRRQANPTWAHNNIC